MLLLQGTLISLLKIYTAFTYLLVVFHSNVKQVPLLHGLLSSKFVEHRAPPSVGSCRISLVRSCCPLLLSRCALSDGVQDDLKHLLHELHSVRTQSFQQGTKHSSFKRTRPEK